MDFEAAQNVNNNELCVTHCDNLYFKKLPIYAEHWAEMCAQT